MNSEHRQIEALLKRRYAAAQRNHHRQHYFVDHDAAAAAPGNKNNGEDSTSSSQPILLSQRQVMELLQERRNARTEPTTTQQQPQRRSLLDLPAVEQWASQHGLKEHHLKTIYRILLQTPPPTILQLQLQRGGEVVGSTSGDAVVACRSSLQERFVQASFPSKLAAQLLQDFDLCSLQLIERHPSRSGGEKLVLQLTGAGKSSSSPERVETVLIRHDTSRCHSSSSTTVQQQQQQQLPRYTVCVSSQVGCARACTFCATGTLGLQRQLTSAELLEQVWMAQHLVGAILADEPQQSQPTQSLVRNVVFMVRIPTCGVECALFCTNWWAPTDD